MGGFALKVWSWASLPEGERLGRMQDQDFTGLCVAAADPSQANAGAHSCKKWARREAKGPGRPPALIILKT